MSKLVLKLTVIFLVFASSKCCNCAQAQTLTTSFTNVAGQLNPLNSFNQFLRISDFPRDSLFFYDQEEEQIVLLSNITSGRIRVALMNTDYELKHVFRAADIPKVASQGVIEEVQFYPTRRSLDGKKKAGLLVVASNRFYMSFDLLNLKSHTVEFNPDYFDGQHSDSKFLELSRPKYVK